MKKPWILCSTLFITACASTQPQLPEVQVPPERILQNGYSLLPLNEKGWFVAERNAYQLGLAKFGKNSDETFAIQAIPFRLPAFKTNEEFVRLVKEEQAKDTDPQRFKIVKNEVSSFPMAVTECAKTYSLMEDNAAIKRTEKQGSMVLEALILTCAHPNDKNVGISIMYSERYYPRESGSAFIEKATSILNSVEFTEPQQPYFTKRQQFDSESPSDRFSALCSEMLRQKTSANLPSQLSLPQAGTTQEINADPLHKLASMGISIGRIGSTTASGSYAYFEKSSSGGYSLVAVKPSYFELNNIIKNEEVLFVSQSLDNIAPAFGSFDFKESRQAFICGTGDKNLTKIDSSNRKSYNPCDSTLTSTKVGSSILANTLLTVATFGVNVITGSSATFVDTDKEKVANLVVNSELFECIKEANLAVLNGAMGSVQ